jgi:hypothetical protein
MIRSGSTLQYNIARSIVEAVKLGKGEGWISPDRLEEKRSDIVVWAREKEIHIIKSHVIPRPFSELGNDGEVRFCYIYRDIRDVAVSAKNKWPSGRKELLEGLDKAVATYYEIQSLRFVLTQRYECVINDLFTMTREIADFLDLHPTDDLVHRVAEENSLEKAQTKAINTAHDLGKIMKSVLLRIGLRLRAQDFMRIIGIPISWRRSLRDALIFQDDRTLLHPDHISKNRGSVGVWRKELTEEEISIISTRYKKWLQEAGFD